MSDFQGIVVPGGFGERGVEGITKRSNTHEKIRSHFWDYAMECSWRA